MYLKNVALNREGLETLNARETPNKCFLVKSSNRVVCLGLKTCVPIFYVSWGSCLGK